MFEFYDKKVVVVGAGSGIGRSVAIKFAKKGASVACISKNESKCSETAELAGKNAGESKQILVEIRNERRRRDQ